MATGHSAQRTDERIYDPSAIEPKWQAAWEAEGVYRASDDPSDRRPRFYGLDMFPYPSGHLHMGHAEAFAIGDTIPRRKWMQGYNVLHPIGWDSFGLPAENAAIQRGENPRVWTNANVEDQKATFKRYGMSFDWTRELHTHDPEYYRWTQWLFLKLYGAGLAYRKMSPVNWCPKDQTVLANEQVINGRCERCDTPVVRRDLTQWFCRITAYADRLLGDMSLIEGGWSERVLTMQRNWIGRSRGAEVTFEIAETGDRVPVFTTRPDTLWGVMFFVFAPEHQDVLRYAEAGDIPEAVDAVRDLQDRLQRADPAERAATREGVRLGVHAVNPVTGEPVPCFVAPYVLMEYGTGAVMGVPGHDQRDFEFAREHDLDVRVVIEPPGAHLDPSTMSEAYAGEGVMVRSARFDGTPSPQSIERVIEWLESDGKGRRATSYRLRDWLISRQRAWGPPIPIIHCPKCGEVPVPEDQLPVSIPDDLDFTPFGESPLARHEGFATVDCPTCGGRARRETDTMDTFVDSSWYFLRYVSPNDDREPFARTLVERWLPVDHYTGGINHAILHLLYSRFVTKALYDLGYVRFVEPFRRVLNQGMVIWKGKMFSKSRGIVIEPGPLIDRWGADSIRLAMMFAAPVEDDIDWATVSVAGVHKWLGRVWRAVHDAAELGEPDGPPSGASPLRRLVHRTIRSVNNDYDRMALNVAISKLMTLTSELQKAVDVDADPGDAREAAETLLLLLAPMAPHICEELWRETLGHQSTIVFGPWPGHDEALARDERVVLVVQVNGKVRDRLEVGGDTDEAGCREAALSSQRVVRAIDGQEVERVVVRAPRLVNVVTRR